MQNSVVLNQAEFQDFVTYGLARYIIRYALIELRLEVSYAWFATVERHLRIELIEIYWNAISDEVRIVRLGSGLGSLIAAPAQSL